MVFGAEGFFMDGPFDIRNQDSAFSKDKIHLVDESAR
jgi:hypothetical protein